MSSDKGMIYVDISVKRTGNIIYTNRDYRRRHDKTGNYIDGVHKALIEQYGYEILDQIDENTGALFSNVIQDALGKPQIKDTESVGIGIATEVKEALAEEIVERATKYCPEDTGHLKSTIKIVKTSDGRVFIVYDCEYAWFVHEFVWRHISREKNPFATAKWLDIAIQEVYKEHGLL